MRKGEKASLQTRKRMSLSKKGKYIAEKNPNWKGGRMLIGNYWYIYSPAHPNRTQLKYVAENRLVMEKKIKRYLSPAEVVHHLNGIKTDNRIKNLVLFKSSGEHTIECHTKRDKQTGRFK